MGCKDIVIRKSMDLSQRIFPSGNFPRVFSLVTTLQVFHSRSARSVPPPLPPNHWEITARKITHLGSCHFGKLSLGKSPLGKYHWENTENQRLWQKLISFKFKSRKRKMNLLLPFELTLVIWRLKRMKSTNLNLQNSNFNKKMCLNLK